MLLAIGVYQLLMHIMVILGKQKKMVLKLLNSALLIQKYPFFNRNLLVLYGTR
jgi:hypothetical protein